MKKIIIVGIGNPLFKDDGVGYWIVKNLKKLKKISKEINIVSLLSTDLKVLDVILGYEIAIIIDAVKTGNFEPGTILEIDPFQSFEKVYASGTHNLTLFEVLKIGYKIFPEEMPKEIKIIGIEIEDFYTWDKNLSSKVKEAIPKVVEIIKCFTVKALLYEPGGI